MPSQARVGGLDTLDGRAIIVPQRDGDGLRLLEGDGDGNFVALATKGVIDAAVAERLAKLAARERVGPQDVSDAVLVDLDVFLRSIELGAPAPPARCPARRSRFTPRSDRVV